MLRLLLVEDDLLALDSTRKILEYAGYHVSTATNGEEALNIVRTQKIDLIVSDVRMPKMDGMDFLKALHSIKKNIPIILMTAFGKIEDAVSAMKYGALDFLTKPFRKKQLLAAIETALKHSAKFLNQPQTRLPELIGTSGSMQHVGELISRVARVDSSVLILGESGTGKELVAKSIHAQSARASGPWITVNCAALPENLIEAELFGVEKGAFTGALKTQPGLFHAAHQGTLFLDEIGDMPLSAQAKLLRVLQEGEIRRVGSTMTEKVSVRVIAATHQNLQELVAQERFREDLLYRLQVFIISIPPLRDRIEDLEKLVTFFLQKTNQNPENSSQGQKIILQQEVWDVLKSYSWPGNIRELSNVIERAIVFCTDGIVKLTDLPPQLSVQSVVSPLQSVTVPIGVPLKEVEELLIRKTLEATDGDKNVTAKLLGINSRTIYRKLQGST